MSTLNISLPEALRAFIEEQTKEGAYSTASEYIRALIREDQKRKAESRLQNLLVQGLESGAPEAMTGQYWDEIRRQVQQGMEERKTRER